MKTSKIIFYAKRNDQIKRVYLDGFYSQNRFNRFVSLYLYENILNIKRE